MNTSNARFNRLSVFVTCLLLLVTGCSDKSAQQTPQVICPFQKQTWLIASQAYFLAEPEPIETSAFAAQLQDLLQNSRSGCAIEDLSQPLVAYQQDNQGTGPAGDALPAQQRADASALKPARLEVARVDSAKHALTERHIQRKKLLLAHQITLLGDLHPKPKDPAAMTRQIDWQGEWKEYLDSLAPLHLGISNNIKIYAGDDTKRLLAYRINTPRQRIFAMFNLSFDEQQAPLPLGFMSSTKVRLWRSDDTSIREFVTNAPLFIKPLTVMLLVVG